MKYSKLKITFSSSSKAIDSLLPSTEIGSQDLARTFVISRINNLKLEKKLFFYSKNKFNNLVYPPSPIDMMRYNTMN